MWHPPATRGRKKPYSAIGIGRVPCIRCGESSVFQWQICSDGNQFRGLCAGCDILLNKMVLRFIWPRDWKQRLTRYIAKARELAA